MNPFKPENCHSRRIFKVFQGIHRINLAEKINGVTLDITEIFIEKNSTIIFPVPIVLNKPFLEKYSGEKGK